MKIVVQSFGACLLAGLSVTAEAAWTYDPSAGTLTDGVWTLQATPVKNKPDQLDVKGDNATYSGGGLDPIDLTTITDGAGNAYKAVSFTKMKSDHKLRLTEFIAPDCQQTKSDRCFENFTALTNVQLNATVTGFGTRSFMGCSSLVSFYPRTLNTLSLSCFSGCSKLAGGFSFPDFAGNAVGGWFSGCSSLESVSMPKATQICGTAFQSCSSLTNVEVSTLLTTIGKLAFNGCSSLKGDCIRAILHSGITFLGGNTEAESREIFAGCASFDGAFEWNFPNLTSTNVIGSSFFKDCTSLARVDILTDVLEIRASSLRNLAPGAEIHMPATAPLWIGAEAIAHATAPYARVYLSDNYEAWLDVFGVNHHVFPKDEFNNEAWVEYAGASARDRNGFVAKMKLDTEMCSVKDGKVTVKKGVLAFVAVRKAGSWGGLTYCWVLKEPKPRGLSVIVR